MERKSAEVLVVEDDRDTRYLIRLTLQDAGYAVYEAPDGMKGLDRLRTHPTPLVVVLDWIMPGLDGLEVLRAIAANAPLARRHAFILTTSLYDAPELSLSNLPRNISLSVLEKPFDLNRLLRAVADADRQVSRAGRRPALSQPRAR